jgi:hypothetical protein
MHVLLLILGIAAGFAFDQAWNRRRVRAYYAALGRTVLSLRWRPLAGLLSWSARRGDSVYHVVHAGPGGAARVARCVSCFWGGVRADEDLGPAAALASAAVPARGGGDTRPRGATGISASRSLAAGSTPLATGPTPLASWPASLAIWPALAASALATCLAIGASYWSTPYGAVDLPSALYVPGLLLVPVTAGALAAWQPRAWLAAAAAQIAAVVAVVIVRIALDLARDPTTHNLFPFEIAIALGLAGALALPAAFAGRLARRWLAA